MDISDIVAQINALAAEVADCWQDLIAALPERCRNLSTEQIAGLIYDCAICDAIRDAERVL
jgi:hypothetical protein